MSLLLNNEIENTIGFNVKNALNSITVLTGYCKEKAFNNLAKSVSLNVKNKKIMVRFLLSDVVSGASDLNVYIQAQKYGWDMYIKFDLHSKMYVFDDKTCILGSANLTSRGMNLSNYGNLETAIISDLDCNDIYKIEYLFTEAIKMTDAIYSTMKTQFESVDIKENEESLSWNDEVVKLFESSISCLNIEDLPSEYIDDDTYKALNDFEKDKLKLSFISSKAYLWLKNVLKESKNCEMYFGQLTEALHNKLVSNSRIYRKEVKEYLNILLSWISVLCKGEIYIDAPNYSTRVRLIK